MKRAHRIVPPLLAAAAATVPVLTAIEILTRAGHAQSPSASGLVSAAISSQPATSSTLAAAPTAAPRPPSSSKLPTAGLPASTAAITRVYAGQVVYDQYGGVQATVTVRGKSITNVSISAPQNDPRSASINSQAVPLLISETLQAQSATVNTISGATETSDAYVQSLHSALQKAGL